MSVAYDLVPADLDPVVDVPERARRHRPDASPNGRLASVTVLHRPSPASVAPPLRLTRCGVVVLGAALAVLAAALVTVAWLSAPRAASPASQAPVPAAVTVGTGDSLWSIASRVAPQRDPRAEVADLQRINHLTGTALTPGQVLRTR